MASVRTLPSGSIQVSVLIDTGRRQTATFNDMNEAHVWAAEMEAARDAERERQRTLDRDAHTTLIVDSFCALATAGALSAAQLKVAQAAITKGEVR